MAFSFRLETEVVWSFPTLPTRWAETTGAGWSPISTMWCLSTASGSWVMLCGPQLSHAQFCAKHKNVLGSSRSFKILCAFLFHLKRVLQRSFRTPKKHVDQRAALTSCRGGGAAVFTAHAQKLRPTRIRFLWTRSAYSWRGQTRDCFLQYGIYLLDKYPNLSRVFETFHILLYTNVNL